MSRSEGLEPYMAGSDNVAIYLAFANKTGLEIDGVIDEDYSVLSELRTMCYLDDEPCPSIA